MKVVNLCLCGPVTDNWNYQDNLLPKYQKLNGNEVTIITSEFVWGENGNITFDKRSRYKNENDIDVVRLKCSSDSIGTKLKRFHSVYKSIEAEKPDILFIHGCQFLDIKQVVKYLKKHKNVRAYVDNHADFSNSATNWLSKNILHKIIWKSCAKMIEPYASRFYGVLPARVDFLVDIYGIPKEKTELLVMGADDKNVQKAKNPEVKKQIRNEIGASDGELLIVTGGKIDTAKTQTLLLMEAVQQLEKVKLLVFGSVEEQLKQKFDALCSDKVKYIGWIDSQKSYNYFAAADLVVFPGRHSVFWEECAGIGVPMIVKYWEGTTHIDMGGNVRFLYQDSVEEIKQEIGYCIEHIDEMKKSAEANAKQFLYSDIARKSIEG